MEQRWWTGEPETLLFAPGLPHKLADTCNGGTVTNLQHDGVIMRLAPHITPVLACVELTIACTNTLGYPQPVEEKPLDDQTGDGSDSEDDQDNDDYDDNNNDDDDDDDSAYM